MNNIIPQDSQGTPLPAAVFSGDFNAGKSLLINALLHQNSLFISREESMTPPVLVAKSDDADVIYGARPRGEREAVPLSREQFLSSRKVGGVPCESDALCVLAPEMPFRHFVLVDTPGASSQENRPAIPAAAPALDNALFVLVTTLEYWPARHTMSLIREYQMRFPGRFIVVANMADHINTNEIRRVRDKGRQRMERNGIAPAPPFFTLSARLELARRTGDDEYRRRIKADVRELCDAGFDAFRVALYEFEAKVASHAVDYDLETLLNSPLAEAVIMNQKGQKVC